MRILVVSDLFPPVSFGGYEIECAALVSALRPEHDVWVLTSDRDARAAPPEDGVLRVLPYVGPRRREALRAPAVALESARQARRALARAEPDLVYVSNCAAVSNAAPLVAAGHPRAAVVYRFSERWFASHVYRGDRFLRHLGPERGPRAAWGAVLKAVNRLPDLRLDPHRPRPAAISWGSRALRQSVELSEAIEPVLERVIHPAGEHAEAYGGLERRPRERAAVVYVGRITEAKGAPLAVEALARLRDGHGLEPELLLAGPAEPAMQRRLQARAEELGLGRSVRLLGRQSHEAVGELLAGAHAVVVPTLDFDTFPLVVVEAALARAPVVAARLGGIPEALEEDSQALLFAPGDAGDCAAALARTLADREAAEARAARAFERARTLTPERYVQRSREFVAEAAAELGRRPLAAPTPA
jgi:glycosyltransferase involved in cell wall biosynthesis